MKHLLLYSLLLLSAVAVKAQNVATLSPGKYEAKLANAQKKWDKGDVILVDDSHYKISTSPDVGEYRFSSAAQRIFFTSGPLKSAFTKVSMTNGKAVIIFPVEQNGDLGLTAEVWASKQ